MSGTHRTAAMPTTATTSTMPTTTGATAATTTAASTMGRRTAGCEGRGVTDGACGEEENARHGEQQAAWAGEERHRQIRDRNTPALRFLRDDKAGKEKSCPSAFYYNYEISPYQRPVKSRRFAANLVAAIKAESRSAPVAKVYILRFQPGVASRGL